jgi:hypothetical protein
MVRSAWRVEKMLLLVAGFVAFWTLNTGSPIHRKVGKVLPEKRGRSELFLRSKVVVSKSKVS